MKRTIWSQRCIISGSRPIILCWAGRVVANRALERFGAVDGSRKEWLILVRTAAAPKSQPRTTDGQMHRVTLRHPISSQAMLL